MSRKPQSVSPDAPSSSSGPRTPTAGKPIDPKTVKKESSTDNVLPDYETVEHPGDHEIESFSLKSLDTQDASAGKLLPGLSADHLRADEIRSAYGADSPSAGMGGYRATGFGAKGGGGGWQPKNILGEDNRERVTDTTVKPFPYVCMLRMQTPSGTWMLGTGWLAGPRTVVTAGHCVYNHESQYGVGWMKKASYQVFAGANGSTLAGKSGVDEMFTTSQWTSGGSDVDDFAVLRLSSPLGASGFFQFAAFGDQELQGMLVNVVGYPGDKNNTGVPQMWADANYVSAVEPQRLAYQSDTMGGQSGGPVINWQNSGMYVVGIHNYGGSQSNFGTRINSAVFKKLSEWRA